MAPAGSAGRGLLERSGRVSTGAASRICGLLPPSDAVSPVILAAATRAIHDLIASPQRGAVRFVRVEEALEKGGGYWRRQGIYLSPDLTGEAQGSGETVSPLPHAEAYAGLFGRFLEAGFLLPPGPDQPAILPAVLSEGEEAKLAKLLAFGL
jgi:hypothetical protein